MRTSTITSILVLAAPLGALASPTTKDASLNPISTLVKRDDKCQWTNDAVLTRWDIWVDNDASANLQCGDGCLDNIRGRCGSSVTDWGCDRNDQGQGYYHFNTPTTCTAFDMTEALKACLSGRIINCNQT